MSYDRDARDAQAIGGTAAPAAVGVAFIVGFILIGSFATVAALIVAPLIILIGRLGGERTPYWTAFRALFYAVIVHGAATAATLYVVDWAYVGWLAKLPLARYLDQGDPQNPSALLASTAFAGSVVKSLPALLIIIIPSAFFSAATLRNVLKWRMRFYTAWLLAVIIAPLTLWIGVLSLAISSRMLVSYLES